MRSGCLNARSTFSGSLSRRPCAAKVASASSRIPVYKTLMQVTIAENVIRQTNQRVLILTPLAVAFQFIDEATRIGVHDIEHTKDGTFTKRSSCATTSACTC